MYQLCCVLVCMHGQKVFMIVLLDKTRGHLDMIKDGMSLNCN